MYRREYEFAKANPTITACKHLLDLAAMYARHADEPTLGLIQGAVDKVRTEIERQKNG